MSNAEVTPRKAKQDWSRNVKNRTEGGPGDAIVQLNIRVHLQARKQLKSTAALSPYSQEEYARSLLYEALGLDFPVVLDATAASTA